MSNILYEPEFCLHQINETQETRITQLMIDVKSSSGQFTYCKQLPYFTAFQEQQYIGAYINQYILTRETTCTKCNITIFLDFDNYVPLLVPASCISSTRV